MTERYAPDDAIWLCNQCGKTSTDKYGIHGDVDPFWDATCQKHAILVEKATLRYGEMGRVKHGYAFRGNQQ